MNNTRVLDFKVGDTAYALVDDDGSWHLAHNVNGIYYGPFRSYYFSDCFISDFDKEEFEKHFKHVASVKMYDSDGNLIAEAEHAIANFV